MFRSDDRLPLPDHCARCAATPVNMRPGGERSIMLVLVAQALASAFIILAYNGTGDSGDSISHYQFARYAPHHPALFLDHWAKPLFVLLACPFAQFGFSGMKIFNALAALGSTWSTFQVARALGMKHPLVAALLWCFMPLNMVLTFSGLTEPLFACLAITAIHLALTERHRAACVLVSFLPFVRSEGLLIVGAFAVYLIVRRQWRPLPWSLAGSLIYSAAGLFVKADPLWVFTRIPYASLDSSYGSGPPFHFVEQLFYTVGVPVFLLFWIGLVGSVVRLVRRFRHPDGWLLIVLSFLLFFIAHSLFWYLGIFHSMGLKRVLIGVAPLMALVAAHGLEMLAGGIARIRRSVAQVVQVLLVAYVAIFPFTPNPAALDASRELTLSLDQRLAIDVAGSVRNELPAGGRICSAHPYVSLVFDRDPFDPAQHIGLDRQALGSLRHGDVVIWENWFAPVEGGVPLSLLEEDPRIREVFRMNGMERGREVQYVVFLHGATVGQSLSLKDPT